MIRSFSLSCLPAALVSLFASASIVSAQEVDVIRGTVIAADGKPLEDVKVTATSISGNVNRTARTDRNGRFTITFPGGEGDYMVEFWQMGTPPARSRVQLR